MRRIFSFSRSVLSLPIVRPCPALPRPPSFPSLPLPISPLSPLVFPPYLFTLRHRSGGGGGGGLPWKDVFMCFECKKTFSSREKVQFHYRGLGSIEEYKSVSKKQHESIVAANFQCENCLAYFRTKKEQDSHGCVFRKGEQPEDYWKFKERMTRLFNIHRKLKFPCMVKGCHHPDFDSAEKLHDHHMKFHF